jgi:hypothetical protein
MTDVASLENASRSAKESIDHAANDYSACVERLLRVMTIIEETLRERRGRIEAIRTRHQDLVREYRQLGKSLEAETSDLARKFTGVISDLGTDVEIVRLLLGDGAAAASTADLAVDLTEPSAVPDRDQDAGQLPDGERDEPVSLRPALDRILKRANLQRAEAVAPEDA